MKNFHLGLVLMGALSACGDRGDGLSFVNIQAIVASAAPAAFSTSTNFNSFRPFDSCSGGYASPTAVFSCIDTYVLSDTQPSGAVGQWFQWWVKGLDTRLAEFTTRFSDSKPSCADQTPVDLNLAVSASGSTLTGVDLSIPVSFSCFEAYAGPSGTGVAGGVAFGTKDGNTYVMDRSFGNGSATEGAERILSIAKVNAAGDEAEIWVLLNGTTEDTPSIMRIKANKTTKAFSYENRASADFNYFKYLYLRSDSTKMYTVAQQSDGSPIDLGSNDCVESDSVSTPATGCTTDSLDDFPTSTFLSTMITLPTVSSASVLYDAMDTIAKQDLAAAGVGVVAE